VEQGKRLLEKAVERITKEFSHRRGGGDPEEGRLRNPPGACS